MIIKDDFADLEQIRLRHLEDKIIDALIEFDKDKEMQWIGIRFEKVLLETLLKTVEKQLSSGWIPVSERLPKEDEEVLITLAHGKATWAYLYQGEWNTMFSTYPIERVIAWQPLPMPYKEEEEDDAE